MATNLSIAVFAIALIATLVVSYLGRRHEERHGAGPLVNQGLNRWLVGLSAGATANSGFVVTAAVGLGYSYGARWLLLPLAWLVGDILFWVVFPQRINQAGAEAKATTLTDVLVRDVNGRTKSTMQVLIGLITLMCLGGYVSAQWLSGQKFLSGAFGLDSLSSLLAFAAVIVIYSALGGFRGSVYADTLQAAIRIIGTAVAIVAVWVAAARHEELFWSNIEAAGPDFLRLIPTDGAVAALISCAGFAAAALGFGLGQPQIVTRYLAGASPKETQSAWWIYLLFVQATWIAMTAFGIALRGVMPTLDDPETGLSVFHRTTTGPVVTGIISADIFATIAATSNGILVAMGQSLMGDLLPRKTNGSQRRDLWLPITVLGVSTMVLSLFLHTSVKDLALSSVGMMGAGLAPAMMIQVLGWRHTGLSLLLSVIFGFGTAALWTSFGYNAIINEAAPGIIVGLAVNLIAAPMPSRQTSAETGGAHDEK
jgi:sodium/proline symporter